MDTNIDQPEEYEVGKIFRKRKVLKRNGRLSHTKYLIVWKDYPIEEATWELESSFK